MKKTVLLLLCALLLASCAKPAAVRFEPARSFASDFTLETGDYIIEGRLTCNAYDDIRLSFTHPALLSYFTVRASSEGYTTDVAGAADEIEARQVPTFAPINILCEALRTAVFTQTQFTKTEAGELETRVPVGGAEAAVVFSPEGAVREIRCERQKLKVSFFG